jgi:CDP-paratose 2-epimerase
MRVLVTGGAGFIGSTLALMLKRSHDWSVVAFDNLRRRGSELNLDRLRAGGVEFVHGDIRNPEDLDGLPPADLILECSAEPSVHAGYNGGARYVVATNLIGTFNCLEWARQHGTGIVYLSTSRVHSIAALRALPLVENASRFELPAGASGPGWSADGISETFATTGARSLYGATKLASELLVEEYRAAYGLSAVINRCGVIAGPWQMGKVDQGFVVLWAARHLFGGALSYSGFGGTGRQVRDVLHVDDLFDLVERQIANLACLSGGVFNVGGGPSRSVSLAELSALCAMRAGGERALGSDPETRPADIPYYVTNCSAVTQATGWIPRRSFAQLLDDVFDWLRRNRGALQGILGWNTIGK